MYDVIKPQIGGIYAKEFQWRGRKAADVPLDQGRVEPSFYGDLSRSGDDGPISVHVEYLKEGQTKENIAALRRDFQTPNEWMAA